MYIHENLQRGAFVFMSYTVEEAAFGTKDGSTTLAT